MTRKKRRRNTLSRIRPWPNSTFDLQIEVEHDRWDKCKHVWVFLCREAPGRPGRLKAMHGIVPMRKRKNDEDRHFASPSYRLKMIRSCAEVLLRAGVSDDQAKKFMLRVVKEYPAPTRAALYGEKLTDPMVRLALGERRGELSYFKTGVREWRREDDRLLNQCLDDLERRWRMDKKVRDEFNRIVLGTRSRGHRFRFRKSVRHPQQEIHGVRFVKGPRRSRQEIHRVRFVKSARHLQQGINRVQLIAPLPRKRGHDV